MNSRKQLAAQISPIRRTAYFCFGIFFLMMGIIGIFVPVWPTTCFLIFAVGCFSKSSKRMHDWMLENPYFGSHLRQYRESGTIERKILVGSLVSLWLSLTMSLALVTPPVWVALLILAVGAAVTFHLLMLKIADRPARQPELESRSPMWRPRSRSVGMLGTSRGLG